MYSIWYEFITINAEIIIIICFIFIIYLLKLNIGPTILNALLDYKKNIIIIGKTKLNEININITKTIDELKNSYNRLYLYNESNKKFEINEFKISIKNKNVIEFLNFCYHRELKLSPKIPKYWRLSRGLIWMDDEQSSVKMILAPGKDDIYFRNFEYIKVKKSEKIKMAGAWLIKHFHDENDKNDEYVINRLKSDYHKRPK